MKVEKQMAVTKKTEREKLLQSQEEYCKKNKLPHFAPQDGICTNCKKDMVNKNWKTTLITSCPNCNKSYCE